MTTAYERQEEAINKKMKEGWKLASIIDAHEADEEAKIAVMVKRDKCSHVRLYCEIDASGQCFIGG